MLYVSWWLYHILSLEQMSNVCEWILCLYYPQLGKWNKVTLPFVGQKVSYVNHYVNSCMERDILTTQLPSHREQIGPLNWFRKNFIDAIKLRIPFVINVMTVLKFENERFKFTNIWTLYLQIHDLFNVYLYRKETFSWMNFHRCRSTRERDARR